MDNLHKTAAEQQPVFINPLEDLPFKILFGPGNKRNMIGLLKAILGRDIEDITYINTEKLGLTKEESFSQYDLSVLFTDGTRCVVEMQKTNLKYFNYRSVFYCSHLVQLQASEERERQREKYKKFDERPSWNYYFPPVYLIGILSRGGGIMDEALKAEDPQKYLFHYRNREIVSGGDMGVEVNYLFLHLDRFGKAENECKSLLEQLAYSLKNMKNERERPKDFNYNEMQNLYDTAFFANLPKEQAHAIKINDDMTTENDILVAIREAREDAREEALKEGMEKWMEKGMKKGMKEGIKEGMERARIDNASKMKEKNYPVADICEITGLSEEIVLGL